MIGTRMPVRHIAAQARASGAGVAGDAVKKRSLLADLPGQPLLQHA